MVQCALSLSETEQIYHSKGLQLWQIKKYDIQYAERQKCQLHLLNPPYSWDDVLGKNKQVLQS